MHLLRAILAIAAATAVVAQDARRAPTPAATKAPAPAPAPAPAAPPATAPPNTPCTTQHTRYECRELSGEQKTALQNAFRNLMTSGAYNKFIAWHVAVDSTAHGVPEFLVWHRTFLRALEIELGVPLCYWDWSIDAQAPEVSIMNAPGWCGTNGKGGCVTDAFYGSFNYNGQCVSNQWDGSDGAIGALYSVDYVAKLITDSTSYDQFRSDYEGTAHARVHNGIGGEFAQMTSPMDPRFFFHHCNVDRHYAIWQRQHPDKRNDYPKDAATTMLPVFNVPVQTAFDHSGPGYCYTYSNMDIISTGRSTVGLNKRSLAEEDGAPLVLSRLARRLQRRDEQTLSHVAPADDRKNMVDLRAVNPAPGWWIEMNHLNETRIRELEAQHGIFIDTLNALPGYVSPCALYNRPQLLEQIVARPDVHEMEIPSLNGEEPTRVNCTEFRAGHTDGAVDLLRNKVKEVYKVVDYDELRKDLKDAVGDVADFLADCGKRFANKPFEYNPDNHKDDVSPQQQAKQPREHHKKHHCHRKPHHHRTGAAPADESRPHSRYQPSQSRSYGERPSAY